MASDQTLKQSNKTEKLPMVTSMWLTRKTKQILRVIKDGKPG